MGNNRGCQYSVAHTTLNPSVDRAEFWNFDFEDMGTKDVPAEIDFILSKTGQSKVGYVGHSEGTTQFFIGSSMLPEYFAEKVNVFIALAPVARLTNTMSSFFRLLAFDVSFVEHVLVDDFGIYGPFTLSWVEQWAVAQFCESYSTACGAFIELIADLDPSRDNFARAKSFLTHMPSGAGYRNLVHYGQLINGVDFLRYDWGTELNMQKYGQATPPKYPLEAIKVPTALFGGGEDELAAPADVDWLNGRLGSTVVFYKQYPQLGHLTFAIGKDMTFFQVDAMKLLKQYATNTAQDGFLSYVE